MKKSIIILLSLISGILGSSFTSKLIMRGTIGAYITILASKSDAQNVVAYTDIAAHKYYLLITNPTGPTNPTVCASILEVNSGGMFLKADSVIFTSMVTHTDVVNGNNKMFSINPNGKLCASTFSNMSIPFSQISNTTSIQSKLNGMGFIKSSGSTITYDNSTYLTNEVDGDPDNEKQILSINSGSLLLSLGGGTISLPTTDLSNYYTKSQSDLNYKPLSYNPSLSITGQTLSIIGSNSITIPVQDLSTYATISSVSSATSSLNSNINTKAPLSRSITINGLSQDLSSDRIWTIPTGSVYTAGSNISIVGGIISNTSPIITQTMIAGSSMSVVSGANTFTFINTSPDQIVSLTGTNGNTVTGTYPNFTITKKRQDTYTGTTNASGVVTFTFTSFSSSPNVQYTGGFGSTNKETIIPNAAYTATSCSFYVQLRSDVIGLLPTYSNVSGREVNVIVTEK